MRGSIPLASAKLSNMKKKKHEKQIYVADCIEHGERFSTIFMTDVTDEDTIHQFGVNEAAQWGGECIQVVKIEETNLPYPKEKPWDMDLSIEENLNQGK